MLAAFQGLQAGIWTALPGVVQSFDEEERTVEIQPTIQIQVQKKDGSKEWVDMPLLVDCPVIFPSGGGVTLTFPLRMGDECLVIFASRCIDSWWDLGSEGDDGTVTQVQPELRMHDLSDGFCMAGISSKPQVIPDISTNSAQLRNDSGLTYIELIPGDGDDDPQGGTVNIVTELTCNVIAGGNITATTEANIIAHADGDAMVTVDGDIEVTAGGDVTVTTANECNINASTINLNGVLVINGQPYLDHTHSRVTAGIADTGEVNGP